MLHSVLNVQELLHHSNIDEKQNITILTIHPSCLLILQTYYLRLNPSVKSNMSNFLPT